jgi:MFS family permease
MGIGATTVIYMLNCGISLADVALIKIVQAVVIFFAEVPTGIIADRWGRKLSMQLACISAVFGFLSFVLIPNFLGFTIAEIFNALTISFWSGAFESLAVDNTKADKKEPGFIQYFFHKINKYAALAVMIAGLVGGLLGDIDLVYPFYLSTFLMLLSLIFISIQIPELKAKTVTTVKTKKLTNKLNLFCKHIKNDTLNAFRFSFSSETIKKYFIIQVAIQFAMQPVLQYWQPYFEETSEIVTAKTLGAIFFCYVLVQSMSSWLLSTLYKRNLVTAQSVTTFTSSISCLAFLTLSISQYLSLSIIAFFVLQASISSYRNNIAASFNKYIDAKQRSAVLSAVSFISRSGMFLHLAIMQFTMQLFPVRYSFFFSFVGALFFVYYSVTWETENKISHSPLEVN